MKKNVIDRIVRDTGWSAADAVRSFDAVFAAVKTELEPDGAKVNVPGFGVFTNKFTPGRTGRNPRTGEPVAIQEGHKVKFRPSKAS